MLHCQLFVCVCVFNAYTLRYSLDVRVIESTTLFYFILLSSTVIWGSGLTAAGLCEQVGDRAPLVTRGGQGLGLRLGLVDALPQLLLTQLGLQVGEDELPPLPLPLPLPPTPLPLLPLRHFLLEREGRRGENRQTDKYRRVIFFSEIQSN